MNFSVFAMPGEIRYHRRVATDISDAENYYLNEGGSELADRFVDELFTAFALAAENPLKAHYDLFARSRRVNLKNFPYHFLYENYGDYILVFLVRHDKRHPTFGLRRKR